MGPQKALVGSLSHLTVKLQKKLQQSCTAVKGITDVYVGRPGAVLSGMAARVEREGEEPEFVPCPGMRKAEGLGTGCETSWHVALKTQRSAGCGCEGQQRNTPLGPNTSCLRARDARGCETNPLFLIWSSAPQDRQRPLDPVD